MSIQALRDALGPYAKDIKLNLGSVLTEEGAPDLTQKWIWAIALACSYAGKQPFVIRVFEAEAAGHLSTEEMNAARAAATMMAMNNIYYRFKHGMQDEQLLKLPANLRMSILANPGVDKVTFELMSLAVSAINGCGACMHAHTEELIQKGISRQGINSCIRIAAVVQATSQAVTIGESYTPSS